jgi:hypothetical protein
MARTCLNYGQKRVFIMVQVEERVVEGKQKDGLPKGDFTGDESGQWDLILQIRDNARTYSAYFISTKRPPIVSLYRKFLILPLSLSTFFDD